VGTEGNLVYRPRGPGFLQDLADCKAIIGTTGFSLIADAIHLQKPYFGVPLKGQFEQTLNAFFLAESGLGEFSEEASPAAITAFLSRLPEFRRAFAGRHSHPAEQEETLRQYLGDLEAARGGKPTIVFPALSPK
jgi:UDP:flavonoid glycosyltransferase YjiC (YdhE family)